MFIDADWVSDIQAPNAALSATIRAGYRHVKHGSEGYDQWRKQMMDRAGAEKKLRQASFFLRGLRIASDDRQGGTADPEHLEFYFSACLSAAQSAYYVLDETGGATFKNAQRVWRSRLSASQRSNFGNMIGLRDNDVHRAQTDAQPLPKYAIERPSLMRGFVGGGTEVEMENPDGTKVRGPVLRGTLGLYIEQQGQRVDVITACGEFITLLESLVVEAAK
jgi:hypothetical protein